MIEEDWDGFWPAFTAAARSEDPSARNGRRALYTGVAGVLALAASALIYGAFDKASAPSSAAGAAPAWTAVAGPTCTSAAASFEAAGYSSAAPGAELTGWTTTPVGGYVGNGCGGGFVSMPLSGQAQSYDPSRSAIWDFTLGAGYASATCKVAVYVPAAKDLSLVGGSPADYVYYGSSYKQGASATAAGAFTVDQPAHPGSWVTAASVPTASGQIAVQLIDAGLNQTPATRNAHAAAAQLRLTCQPA